MIYFIEGLGYVYCTDVYSVTPFDNPINNCTNRIIAFLQPKPF